MSEIVYPLSRRENSIVTRSMSIAYVVSSVILIVGILTCIVCA